MEREGSATGAVNFFLVCTKGRERNTHRAMKMLL
jgi:hypothetical protein